MRWLRQNAWLLGAAAVSLVITVQPLRDTDVWWHLAMGRYILAHGIPAAEPFSFLHAANPWVGQQWLYEVALARVVQVGPGLASLLMGMVASAALLIAMLSIPPARRPAGPWMAAALLLSALVAAQLVGVRGQVISLFFAAVVLLIVRRWRAGSNRALLALPPLFALWANLHAGFIIGLGIALVALVCAPSVGGRARRLLAVALAASALATLLNPAGPGLWGYVAGTFTNPTVTGVVTEWQSPDFHGWWLRLFELEALLLAAAWLLTPRRRDRFDLVLAALAVAASLQAQRNVSLFALIAAPQLAVYGSSALEALRGRLPSVGAGRRWRGAPRWFGSGILAVVIAATAAAVVPQLTSASAAAYEATHDPEASAGWAAQHLAGHRLYSIDTWGGYLADRFPAGRVVYLYDETAVFGDAALQQYLDIHDLRPDWATVLTSAGIRDAILPDGAQEVAALLTLGWVVDCHDRASSSVVMSAAPPGTASPSPAGGPAEVDAAPSCG